MRSEIDQSEADPPIKTTEEETLRRKEKNNNQTVACISSNNKKHGHALHSREIQHLGATPDPTQDRGQRERLRPPVLRDGPVLSEPRVLGDGAADPPGGHGPECGRQHAGRAGAEREERQEGDQSAEHAALHQGQRLEVFVWEGGGQAGAGQRRRQDVLHHRKGAADQRVHLGAQGEQQLELRRLHRRHRGGHPHAQRVPRQSHRPLAQRHHADDQVQRVGHRPGQVFGWQIGADCREGGG